MGLWVPENPGLRLLCAWSIVGGGYAGGDHRLDSYRGRLFGVGSAKSAEGARERAAQESGPYCEPSYPQRPSLEEMLAFTNGYVPEELWDDFAIGLEEKYRPK